MGWFWCWREKGLSIHRKIRILTYSRRAEGSMPEFTNQYLSLFHIGLPGDFKKKIHKRNFPTPSDPILSIYPFLSLFPKGHLFNPLLFSPLSPLFNKKKKWKNSSPTKQNAPLKHHQQAKEKKKENKDNGNGSFQKVLFWVKMGNRTLPQPFSFQFVLMWRGRVGGVAGRNGEEGGGKVYEEKLRIGIG